MINNDEILRVDTCDIVIMIRTDLREIGVGISVRVVTGARDTGDRSPSVAADGGTVADPVVEVPTPRRGRPRETVAPQRPPVPADWRPFRGGSCDTALCVGASSPTAGGPTGGATAAASGPDLTASWSPNFSASPPDCRGCRRRTFPASLRRSNLWKNRFSAWTAPP